MSPLSSLLFLLNPFLASFWLLSHQLHHPLLLLQVIFLLSKKVALGSDERYDYSKQSLQHHHAYHSSVPVLHPKQYLQHHHLHHSSLSVPKFGCFRFGQPLCCGARNMSCKSMDHSGKPIISFVPRSDQSVREVRFGNYCIGRVILPNLVALNERGVQILHKLGQREHFQLNSDGGRRKKVAENFNEREETVILFGPDSQIRERIGVEQRQMYEDEGGQQQSPVVRYSLLSRYLPLRIVKRRIRVEKKEGKEEKEWAKKEEKEWTTVSEPWPSADVLTESGVDCFCDEFCTEYSDCCANYAQACPAIDCEVSRWSEWTQCFADDGHCGVGTRERRRTVVRERANAGRKCPELTQSVRCFKQCGDFIGQMSGTEQTIGKENCDPSIFDLTTVALLLDYHFSNSRRILPTVFFKKKHKNMKMEKERQKSHGKATHFIQQKKRAQNIQYCVHYRIVWLNDQCTDQKEWRTKLSPGKVICAECQPEAQFHRTLPRCASDLEDGQSGFWKLIGPKYCYGIWHRLYSSANTLLPLGCTCSKHFPRLTPFLMV